MGRTFSPKTNRRLSTAVARPATRSAVHIRVELRWLFATRMLSLWQSRSIKQFSMRCSPGREVSHEKDGARIEERGASAYCRPHGRVYLFHGLFAGDRIYSHKRLRKFHVRRH